MGLKDFSIKAASIRAKMDAKSEKMRKSSDKKPETYEGLKALAGEEKADENMGLEVECKAPNKSELPKQEETFIECKAPNKMELPKQKEAFIECSEMQWAVNKLIEDWIAHPD